MPTAADGHGPGADPGVGGTETGGTDTGNHGHIRFAPVADATPEQRAAAQALLDASIAAAARWRDPAVARGGGYRADLAKLARGETRFLHAGNPALRDDGATLDPRHPESVIHAKGPDGGAVVVGVLYVAPVGQHGPTPGAPISNWRTHTGCVDLATAKRQPMPRLARTCPDGPEPRLGREMMHVWFTDRLETAFARRAPAIALRLAAHPWRSPLTAAPRCAAAPIATRPWPRAGPACVALAWPLSVRRRPASGRPPSLPCVLAASSRCRELATRGGPRRPTARRSTGLLKMS